MLTDILQFLTGAFVVVTEGQHAVRFTLGRAGEIVGPGIHWKWPVVQKFVVKCTRDTTLAINAQVVQVAEDLVYQFSASVIYKIVDLRRAVVEIDDVSSGLSNAISMAVQRALRKRGRGDVLNVEAIAKDVEAETAELAAHWGVKIIQFGFRDLAPTAATSSVLQAKLIGAERANVYDELVKRGLPRDVAVALISGAAVVVEPAAPTAS